MLAVRFLVAGTMLFAWCSRRGLPRPTRRQWLRRGDHRDAARVVRQRRRRLGRDADRQRPCRADRRDHPALDRACSDGVFLGERLTGRAWSGSRRARRASPSSSTRPARRRGDLAAVGRRAPRLARVGGRLALRDDDGADGRPRGRRSRCRCSAAASSSRRWAPASGRGIDLGAVTGKSLLALAYLVAVGSVIAYTAYGWLLHNAPPSLVATYAYVNPVVAVLLGALSPREALTLHTLVGGARDRRRRDADRHREEPSAGRGGDAGARTGPRSRLELACRRGAAARVRERARPRGRGRRLVGRLAGAGRRSRSAGRRGSRSCSGRSGPRGSSSASSAASLAIAAWMGASTLWSQSVPSSVLEVERAVVYVAGAAAALLLFRRGAEDGVLAAAAVVCAWNLGTRIARLRPAACRAPTPRRSATRTGSG